MLVCFILIRIREKSCGESYLSQSSPIIHFGLSQSSSVDSLIVSWPSGKRKILTELDVNQTITLYEDNLSPNSINLKVGTSLSFKNDTVCVPVDVILPSAISINSTDIQLVGFQSRLDFIDLSLDNSYFGESNWIAETNATDSVLFISAAGAEEIRGHGVLFTLRFFIPDSADTTVIPIKIKTAVFNNDEVKVATYDGGVKVIEQIYGDLDLNKIVRAYDASLILQYLVDKTNFIRPQKLNADVSGDGTISGLDATLILKYAVNLIDSLPFIDKDSLYLAYGDFTMSDIVTEKNSFVELPIRLNGSENIYSFQGEIHFDPTFLSFRKITWSSLLDDFATEANLKGAKIMISGAASKALNSKGDFATIEFVVKPNALSDSSRVSIKNFRLNENKIKSFAAKSDILSTTTTVDLSQNQSSARFGLLQNYPNPFNPVTTIKYSLDRPAEVKLCIYNLQGQLIEVLVDQKQELGVYDIQWDAGEYGSGVYIYRLVADNRTEIRKMIVLK